MSNWSCTEVSYSQDMSSSGSAGHGQSAGTLAQKTTLPDRLPPQLPHPLLIKQGPFYDFLFIRSCFNILPLNTANGSDDTHTYKKREQFQYALDTQRGSGEYIWATQNPHDSVTVHTLTEICNEKKRSEWILCREAEVRMRDGVGG